MASPSDNTAPVSIEHAKAEAKAAPPQQRDSAKASPPSRSRWSGNLGARSRQPVLHRDSRFAAFIRTSAPERPSRSREPRRDRQESDGDSVPNSPELPPGPEAFSQWADREIARNDARASPARSSSVAPSQSAYERWKSKSERALCIDSIVDGMVFNSRAELASARARLEQLSAENPGVSSTEFATKWIEQISSAARDGALPPRVRRISTGTPIV